MDSNDQSSRYQIRIRGVLSDRLLGAFPEMQARTQDRETILTATLPDQSALHGVLGRIEALGLELLEVRRPRARTGTPVGVTSVGAGGVEPNRRRTAGSN